MSELFEYYELSENHTDLKRIKKEREKARKLKKTQWWTRQIHRGICYYCQREVTPEQLTMDHIVPLARGGQSRPGNIVPACFQCNRNKKLQTPVDSILKTLSTNEMIS